MFLKDWTPVGIRRNDTPNYCLARLQSTPFGVYGLFLLRQPRTKERNPSFIRHACYNRDCHNLPNTNPLFHNINTKYPSVTLPRSGTVEVICRRILPLAHLVNKKKRFPNIRRAHAISSFRVILSLQYNTFLSLFRDYQNYPLCHHTTMKSLLTRDIALLVGLTSMSLVAVILRLFARYKTKVHLGADDYWILGCAILNLPYMAVALWGR